MANNLNNVFVYFSALMDKPVLDKDGANIGELYDIVVKPAQVYPQSSSLVIRKGYLNRKYGLVNWPEIQNIDEEAVRLKISGQGIVFQEKHNNKEELTLRRDILDQQVVDTYNHKVIRVNDIHLLEVEQYLMLAHVDISLLISSSSW
jgi:sporulation protein YlmC with PRC-barrel domain